MVIIDGKWFYSCLFFLAKCQNGQVYYFLVVGGKRGHFTDPWNLNIWNLGQLKKSLFSESTASEPRKDESGHSSRAYLVSSGLSCLQHPDRLAPSTSSESPSRALPPYSALFGRPSRVCRALGWKSR